MVNKILASVMLTLVASTPAAAQGTWAGAPAMPQPRAYFAGCAAGSQLYAFGGYDGAHVDTVAAYDTSSGVWSTRTPMPVQRTSAVCVESGGVIYVFGGTTNAGTTLTTRVDVYDPDTDSWRSPVAPLPTLRTNMGVAVINGIIYAVGGAAGPDLSVVEAYDPVSDTWATKAPMPTPRSYLATGVIDGRLYAVGSHSATTMEIYDPATDTWSGAPPLPTQRFIPGAGVLAGRLYVIGGATSTTLNLVEVFDPATGTWSAGPAMPSDRYGFGTATVDGTLYAFGGASFSSSSFTWLSTVETLSLPAGATPRDRLLDLLNAVRAMSMTRGMLASFESKLQVALSALENPATTADACGALQAFINHARAQTAKHLTSAQAVQLMADAAAIGAALNCRR